MPTEASSSRPRRGVASALGRLVSRMCTDDEDGAALALARIGVGLVVTVALLGHVGAVAEYFSDASELRGMWAESAFSTRWSPLFSWSEPWQARALFGVGVVAHLGWITGTFTRVSTAVAAFTWISLIGRNPLLYGYPDQLGLVLCVLMVFMPTGQTWSVDALLRARRGDRSTGRVPRWCRHLLQLQLAVVYTGTGLYKTGDTWREHGSAIYYTVANPLNRHFDAGELFAGLHAWVLRPMTFSVVAWETAFAGFVLAWWLRQVIGPRRWLPDLRWLFLGVGLAMHLGIQLLVFVMTFSALMVATYAAFLEPSEARRLVAWFRRRAS